MNLHHILNYKKIINLKFDGIYLEHPVADIIDFEWKNILSPPPSNDSKKTIEELNLISSITSKRSKKQEKLVHIVDQDMDSLFKKTLDKYNIQYPKTQIENIYRLIRPIILNIKSLWNRPRPYQLAPLYGIYIDHINTDTHHTAAYPSGHTVYGNIAASTIKQLYPQVDSANLNQVVKTIADNRVIQGVHYPTDNIASIKLSNYIFNKIFKVIK